MKRVNATLRKHLVAALIMQWPLIATAAEPHMQAVTADYIVATLVREKFRDSDCGRLLKVKSNPSYSLSAIAEKARPYLNAAEAKQLDGTKLADALSREAESNLKQMTTKLNVYSSTRDNFLVLFGYVTGRATQARDTYMNLGGVP